MADDDQQSRFQELKAAIEKYGEAAFENLVLVGFRHNATALGLGIHGTARRTFETQ